MRGKSLLVLLVSFFILIGCESSTNEVEIGAILPLTGEAATWGTSMKEGMDLALEELNNEGGIKGRNVSILYEDDQGQPRVGVSALQKILSDDVVALTGVANSSVALALIPIIDRNQLVFISGGASSPELSGSSKYFFRTWPSDIFEAISMANFVKKDMDYSRIGILYTNNEYGVGLKDPFEEEFEEIGGEIVVSESFPQEESDFRSQITRLQRHEMDALYLVGNPREMARIVVQMEELNFDPQVLSTSAFVNEEIIRIAGDAAEGVLLTDASFNPESEDPNTQQFVEAFVEKYDKDPGMLSITGYDAVMVLADVLNELETFDSDSMVVKLRNTTFQGAAGTINFDEMGDISRPIRISIVRNGSFETYATVE